MRLDRFASLDSNGGMTTLRYWIAAVLAAVCLPVVSGEEPKAYVAETTSTSETFRSRVLKVHHFVEADFEYLAYTVEWRGHEVVVAAISTDEVLKPGDEIRCMMRSAPLAVGEGKKAAVSFSMVSSRVTSNDAARLKAVAAEVNRRRAQRAAEASKAAE